MQRNDMNKNEKLKQLEYITFRVEAAWVPPLFSSQLLFSMYRQSDRRCSANRPNCCDCVSLQKFPVPYSLQWFCGRRSVHRLTPSLTRISKRTYLTEQAEPAKWIETVWTGNYGAETYFLVESFISLSFRCFYGLDASMGVSSLALHRWSA